MYADISFENSLYFM